MHQAARSKVDLRAVVNHDYATEVVKLLIDNRADVNAKTKLGWTPLHLAAYYNAAEILLMLIDNGAKVNLRAVDANTNKGKTPLQMAEEEGYAVIKKLLIDNGAK